MHKGFKGSSDITGLSDSAQAELDRLFAADELEGDAGHTIQPRNPDKPTPASFAQELLWMLDRATPGLTAYNIPMVHRLRGALDVRALSAALSAVVNRHEPLRTRFADGDGHPIQVIAPPGPAVIHHVDLSALPMAEREQQAEFDVNERARRHLDLANETPFRITLIRLADDDHLLLIETHHIVVDGWSAGIIFRELGIAYAAEKAGRTPELAPLPLQFGDIAVWERERLSGQRLEELLAFWRTQLDSVALEPLALPTDFARPSVPTFSGARESLQLSSAQLSAIRELGQSQSATLYMTILSAFATVLHRYSARANVLVGSGSAGRSLPESQALVGYLSNTLVQRANFAGNPTFAELLGRVRTSAIDAYDHQEIPLEKLALELRSGQERISHAPLFEVVLTMQDVGGSSLTLEGLTVEASGVKLGTTKFDITLFVNEREDGLVLTAQYRSDLFAPATMRGMLGHMVQVFESAIANPQLPISKIPLLTSAERADAQRWNNTDVHEGASATLVQLFEQQASRVAHQAAVVDASVTLSYHELNTRANQLAHYLRSEGVLPGTPVGLLLDRSADTLVGLLGILKAGAAYVPLSVDAPASRLAQQVAECGTSYAVTSVANAEKLPAHVGRIELDSQAGAASLAAQATNNPSVVISPDSLAYVLFTSGSTGTPKGVAVTHANVVHYTRAISRVLADIPAQQAGDGLSALSGWHFGMVSTLAADLGNTSLFPALLSGGTLHVLSQATTTGAASFAEYVAKHPLDALKITPNHLLALAAGKDHAELAAMLPQRWLVLGGEALRPEVARRFINATKCRVLNHYGPTETTVGVCTFEVTGNSLDAVLALGAATVPVGTPLANTHAYVVDGNGLEQPVSIPGELWLGGQGVAAGYFKRPDLTAERFVQFESETGSERAYRTGDSVRRLASGHIEFLGRIDDQIKVRGYRVELGEIEHLLRTASGVESAVVLLRANADAEQPTLVAYVVAKQSGYEASHSARPTSESLTAMLAAQLPEYMVPGAVVLIDAIPLTANGKVDRAKLLMPDPAAAAQNVFLAPRTETELKIAKMWEDVLKKEAVGLADNFMTLGGHSLLAIRVLGKISKTFGVRLPLRTLFDAPTVQQLAELVDIEVELAAIDAISGNK